VWLLVLVGCNGSSPDKTESDLPAKAAAKTTVRTDKPRRRTIRYPIKQPGFNIEAFQETAVYAKITGYVKEWMVDMGARVKKGRLLAELSVPEMVVEVQQKQAAVRRAEAQVRQAQAAVLTAEAQAARAKSQNDRLTRICKKGVLDRETVDETRLGYEAAMAAVEKAKADVATAEAEVEVAKANRDYARTMLQYTQVRAPYDGVVSKRIVNDDDFVGPAGTGAKGRPLFVLLQDDPVRVFVNVPGADAPWIKDGDPVTLRLQGAGGELFHGKVTRNARSLDPRTRTLRTEIDLPNPARKLLPGMYVQASITIQHARAWTLPATAVVTQGDQTFCYRVKNGRALRAPLQIGLSGGGRVEILKLQTGRSPSEEEGKWEKVTGKEKIVVSDPAALSDGQDVVAKER
jgi:multidrug efflux pump subunit AcrA (membrane-fusion protein)